MRKRVVFLSFVLASASASLAFAQGAEPVPPETPPPPPPAGEAVPPPPPPAQAAPAAQPMAPEPYAPPPTAAEPPEAPDSSKRRHDGFYMRIGLGGGALTMKRDASAESTATGTQAWQGESEIKGGGGAFEFSLGGTVGDGLVICGTLFAQSVSEPTLESDAGDTELASDLSFGLIGPGIHWYPDAKGGFHFGGTLGLAYAVADTPDGSRFERLGGAGGGLSLAVGYDFWIANQWSLGVMGRFTGASVRGEAEEGGVKAEEDDRISAFALMFTVLHH